MSIEYKARTHKEAVELMGQGLEQAKNSKLFVVVISERGTDLSKLASQSADKKVSQEMVVVEAYDSMSPRGFLGAVCRALGEEEKGSLDEAMNRVIASLLERPKLLVIDEANYLTTRSMNHLVHINNKAKVGMVLMGTFELHLAIENTMLERVRSRVREKIWLDEAVKEEMELGPVAEESGGKKKVLRGRFGKAGSGR